jgi:pyrrolidone-carboxylate peptidase
MKSERNSYLHLTIANYELVPITNVNIQMVSDDDTNQIENIDIVGTNGLYSIYGLQTGTEYEIIIEHENFEFIRNNIKIHNGENTKAFIMGSIDSKYIEMGNLIFPIEQEENYVYVWLQNNTLNADTINEIRSKTSKNKSQKMLFPENSEYLIFDFSESTDLPENRSLSSTKNDKMDEFCERIRKDQLGIPSILLSNYGNNPLCIGQNVYIEFYFPPSEYTLIEITEKYNLSIIESFEKNTYYVFRFKYLNYEILSLCKKLNESSEYKIKSITPELISEIRKKSIIPNDFLFPEQWDYNIIQPSLAWQKIKNVLGDKRKFGDSDIKISVVDPDGIEDTHPSFHGNVLTIDGSQIPKVFSKFDFKDYVNNMSGIDGVHGTSCAGAATALANDISDNPSFYEGVVGIAPNCQLGCYKVGGESTPYHEISAMFRWLAGFNSLSMPCIPSGFPLVDSQSSYISSHSWGVYTPEISDIFRKSIDLIVDFGRFGRGHLTFFAVGNDNTFIRLSEPWAEHKKFIKIGASTIDDIATKEIKPQYSNYGLELDFCAPSSSDLSHFPPFDFEITATSLSSSAPSSILTRPNVINRRTTIGHPALNGGITAQTNIISHSGFIINVNDASPFVGLTGIIAGLPGSQWAESRKIDAVDIILNTIKINSPFSTSHIGETITGGDINYRNNFGGTSYSTPVCAGTAALILSVKPTLTWVEVRDIMRNTARKIDLGQDGGIGDWKNGPNESDNQILDSSGNLILKSTPVSTNLTQPALAASNANLTKNFTDSILQVFSNSNFEIGDAVLISNGTNSEIRVIEGLSTGKITVGALTNSYLTPGSTTIEAGEYKPIFSQFYGYGRINVNNAVDEAIKYDHSWRDLIIRDHIADNGTASTQNLYPIHSPDIWIRNTLDSTTPVPPFNHEGPHENPNPNNDRYIYVRVKNMGNGNPALPANKRLKNLDAWVHICVALTDRNNPVIDPIFNPSPGINTPFLFPGDPASQNVDIASKSWSDWNDIHGANGIISGEMKVYHIKDTSSQHHSNYYLAADTIPYHDTSNPEASSYVVRIKWDQLDLPPVTTGQKIYLLAYVSPVDGERQGRGAELNNNMSFREIAFADFEFLDDAGTGALKTNINVNGFGTNENTLFNIKVNQSIGSFKTENVVLEIIRERSNETKDHLIFLYNNSTSAWEILNMNNVAVPITWSDINPPTETATGNPAPPAAPLQTSITFTGGFDVSKEFSKVKIKVTIRGERANTFWVNVAEDTYEMSVIEEASYPTGLIPSPGQPPLYPKSYTFTDFASINTQPADLSFGPSTGSEANKFRVTSSFTASTDVKAYAMVNGFVMIQPGTDADKVNLILRPFTQPIPGFSKVKYIIYRGLRLDEFIDTNDTTKVVAENSASNSEWITQLYATHHNLNPSGDFLSKALGYDLSNQSGSDLIDDYFFSTNADFQLPFISRGKQLGKFFANGGSSDFGIDIILEDRKFIPNLDYARTAFHEIDITGLPSSTDAEKFTKRIKQDEILNFMDLAAFYGIHHTEEGKVTRRNGLNNTEPIPLTDLYNDVIDKFATRNAVYVDIRNELGDSLNFFTNYNDGSGNQIQLGTESGTLPPMAYQTNGWPILIKDNASAPFDRDNDFNEIFLQLRVDDNLSPMLFVKHGDLSTTAVKNKFVEGDNLISGTNPWTNEIGLTYPNTGTSGAKLNVSWFLKLNYSRKLDSNTVYPNTVVQTNYYADNLFGSIDAVQPWDSSESTQWNMLQADQYVDGSESGFGQVSEKGIAVDQAQSTDRVILYTNLTDNFASSQDFTPNSGQTSGTNQLESFLTEPMLFKGYNLEFDIINSSPNITTLRFKQNPDNPILEQNTQILGLSKIQLDSLKSLSGYDNRYPRTIVFDKLGDFIDVNGKPYSKFKLGVHGLDSNGHYLKQFPVTDIEIYSLDELFFTSTDFADLEPIPVTYKRDVEEANGEKLKHPAKILAIESVDTVNQRFTVIGKDMGELSENEKITVSGSAGNNGTYTVNYVVPTGTKYAVVQVKESIPSSASPFGQLSYQELAWQDYFIGFDQSSTIASPPDKMEIIAANFISTVNTVPNNETAPGLLEAAVNMYAPMILNRARAIVKENFSTNPNPDDRILYWARLKMTVAIKSHPYIRKSAIDRNYLIDKFEKLSRGYSTVDFSGVGSSTKKILITGFDPFDILVNGKDSYIYQNNPSGAAALYLHDIDPVILGINAKIQTVIFPVRYRDFDGGVIDSFFDQYLRDNSIDMIITLSQGSPQRYDLERFATKYRKPRLSDNENRRGKKPTFFVPDGTSLKICDDPKSLPEFLETTLPSNVLISTNSSDYNLLQGDAIFNQAWDVNPNKQSAPKRSASNPGDSNIANSPIPPDDTVIKEGSGGDFLSNEIFYRVSLLRTKRASIVKSGHLHLPLMIQPSDIDRGKNQRLIQDVINIIGRL